MIYLLTYDGYMKEEKIQEICPSAKLFMQCGLKDCTCLLYTSHFMLRRKHLTSFVQKKMGKI